MTRAEKAIRNEKMREYKAQGHTMQEVADLFGVCKGTVQQICKGIAPQPSTLNKPPINKGVLKADRDVAEMIKERTPGFRYAGNYTGCDGRVDVQCIECGTITNRSMVSIRHRNIRCRTCENMRIAEREREKNINRDKRSRTVEVNKIKNARQLKLTVCASCGKLFTTWSDRKVYCSKECCKRSNMKTQGSDDRLNKTNIIDKDITLDKLFIRDKGICQICGGRCDYNDYYYNENGVFIAGENYPSKDHIIELCNGGKHSWENIRLAHRGCNSKLFWKKQMHSLPVGVEH